MKRVGHVKTYETLQRKTNFTDPKSELEHELDYFRNFIEDIFVRMGCATRGFNSELEELKQNLLSHMGNCENN